DRTRTDRWRDARAGVPSAARAIPPPRRNNRTRAARRAAFGVPGIAGGAGAGESLRDRKPRATPGTGAVGGRKLPAFPAVDPPRRVRRAGERPRVMAHPPVGDVGRTGENSRSLILNCCRAWVSHL